MKCPHCSIHFHDNWDQHYFGRGNAGHLTEDVKGATAYWMYRSAYCPACPEWTIQMALGKDQKPLTDWRQIYPIRAKRGPVPTDVPNQIAQDYIEACNVLPIGAKASAALARRCLQNTLHAGG